jgi:hypothetical protein
MQMKLKLVETLEEAKNVLIVQTFSGIEAVSANCIQFAEVGSRRCDQWRTRSVTLFTNWPTGSLSLRVWPLFTQEFVDSKPLFVQG